MSTRCRIAIVMLTYNRRAEALNTLACLHALPQTVPIVLVDNASVDGTAHAARARFPDLQIVRLARNIGAAGRNAGVAAVDAEYVAFCDDDTWWSPWALPRAAAVLDAHARIAAVTGRVLVGPENREDETSRRMAASPLPPLPGVPGTQVLGMLAGACMVRRDAYLAAGGYEPRLFLGGEELLLALDWMSAGWTMAYLPEVTIHHHPSLVRDSSARRRMMARNSLWCAVLRRPWWSVAREATRLLRMGLRDAATLHGVMDACADMRWALARRRRVPPAVEAALRTIEIYYGRDRANVADEDIAACRPAG